MSTRQYLIDAATRHQVFLQRYAGGESKKAYKTLVRLRKEILGRLADLPSDFKIMRLRSLLAEVDALIVATMGDMKTSMLAMATELAVSEAEFTASMLTEGSTVSFVTPSSNQLITAVEGTSFNVGSDRLTVAQALDSFGAKKRKEIAQLITDGVVLGDTTQELSLAVRERIDGLIKRQADALVRTSVNHISSVSRHATYAANADVLEGWQFVATLDSRTTILCASHDGQVYDIGKGQMPPLHWNCRSTTIPKVKKAFDLGADVVGGRASKGSSGQKVVSGNETYSGWLKRQSKEFQNEALGVERAKLFRSGEIDLTGFVDPTGRTYTLAELRATKGLSLK